MTRNILVTGIGGDIGQSLIKCLKNIPDYYDKLIGCDVDKYAAGAKLVDEFFVAPAAYEDKRYASFIDSLIEKESIGYIFPISEQEIKFFDKNRTKYDDLVEVFVDDSFILNTFLDKYKTILFLEKYDILCPKTFLPSKYSGELKYPFLIKMRHTHGGKGLVMINDANEFETHKKKLNDDMILQEYVGDVNEEYTVGVFSTGNKTYSIAFRRYLSGTHGGFSRFVELVYDDDIKKLAEKIAKFSGLKGSMNIQMRKVKGKYLIFEINPRISSTVYFRHCFGFPDVKWWMDLEEGKEVKFTPQYSKGIGVKAYGEVFFDLERSL